MSPDRAVAEAVDSAGAALGGGDRPASDSLRPDLNAALAAGLAWQLARWAAARGADDTSVAALRQAALALEAAIEDGHVCLPLADLAAAPPAAAPGAPASSAAWCDCLLRSGVVGVAGQPGAQPLVIDAQQRLYLRRHHDYEVRLARRLLRASGPLPRAPSPDVAAQLRALFRGAAAAAAAPTGVAAANQADRVNWQEVAAALALRQRLVVISGGPGTGKTTTVVNLLACLLAEDASLRIALAAPTGKAAARLTEALRERAAHLPATLRERLPTEAFTVHRLLGMRSGLAGGGFVHHAGQRLPIDLLVVDEASMLDLALATRLLDAVPEPARIVLLGDQHQLAAVEAGAVFAELAAAPALSARCRGELGRLLDLAPSALAAAAHDDDPVGHATLPDCTVWLRQNHRFGADSAIARLAADINGVALATPHTSGSGAPGDGWPAPGGVVNRLRWLADTRSGDAVHWLAEDDADPGPDVPDAVWRAIADGFAPLAEAVRAAPPDPATALRAFARFRVLCALRQGRRGAQAVNARLAQAFAPRGCGAPSPPWWPGRPVQVLRNDPLQRLFNGDTGLCLADADGALQVWFDSADGSLRALAPARLPEHETAYAMTVHKAQGSEFDRVLLLLPGGTGAAHSRVLTRELVYTAVTRARRQVLLASSMAVIAAACARPTRRHSGLASRLHEAALQAAKGGEPALERPGAV